MDLAPSRPPPPPQVVPPFLALLEPKWPLTPALRGRAPRGGRTGRRGPPWPRRRGCTAGPGRAAAWRGGGAGRGAGWGHRAVRGPEVRSATENWVLVPKSSRTIVLVSTTEPFNLLCNRHANPNWGARTTPPPADGWAMWKKTRRRIY